MGGSRVLYQGLASSVSNPPGIERLLSPFLSSISSWSSTSLSSTKRAFLEPDLDDRFSCSSSSPSTTKRADFADFDDYEEDDLDLLGGSRLLDRSRDREGDFPRLVRSSGRRDMVDEEE